LAEAIALQSVPPQAVPFRAEASHTIAIIIGGALCWQQDLDNARKLIGDRAFRFFVVNDHIKTFSGPCIAVTLHPDKLHGQFAWLLERRKKGFPEPEQIWAHKKANSVTHDTNTKEWGGSSGLFAVQVALREGYRKVIGCGIPMTVDGSHYIRGIKWQSAIAFRAGWVRNKSTIAPYFRSMGGWTAEQFGYPNEEWLGS
jgi:hypothetical protein